MGLLGVWFHVAVFTFWFCTYYGLILMITLSICRIDSLLNGITTWKIPQILRPAVILWFYAIIKIIISTEFHNKRENLLTETKGFVKGFEDDFNEKFIENLAILLMFWGFSVAVSVLAAVLWPLLVIIGAKKLTVLYLNYAKTV